MTIGRVVASTYTKPVHPVSTTANMTLSMAIIVANLPARALQFRGGVWRAAG